MSRGSDVDLDLLIATDAELRQRMEQEQQLRSQQKNNPRGSDQANIESARALKDSLRKLTEEVRTLQDRRV